MILAYTLSGWELAVFACACACIGTGTYMVLDVIREKRRKNDA